MKMLKILVGVRRRVGEEFFQNNLRFSLTIDMHMEVVSVRIANVVDQLPRGGGNPDPEAWWTGFETSHGAPFLTHLNEHENQHRTSRLTSVCHSGQCQQTKVLKH